MRRIRQSESLIKTPRHSGSQLGKWIIITIQLQGDDHERISFISGQERVVVTDNYSDLLRHWETFEKIKEILNLLLLPKVLVQRMRRELWGT